MGTSNFVRWASGSSAQLMPIEKYKEHAVIGLVPGIADLEQANRAWFQGTAIACAIAELIVTAKGKYAGVDLSDSESNAEIADKLLACLSARIPAEIADGSIDATKIDMSKFQKATNATYGTVVLATEEEATSGSAGKVITADVFKKSVDKITGGLSSAVTYTEQSLSAPQKTQARKNIDAVSSKELSDGLAGKQNAGDYPTRAEMNKAIEGASSAGAVNAVRYDQQQSLNASQKQQARLNIGAASTEDLAGKQSAGDYPTRNEVRDLLSQQGAIRKTGGRGELAGYESISASAASSINKTSADDVIIKDAIWINIPNGATNETWQKNIVIMNAGVNVAPGSHWKWAGGKAPTIKSGSLLVCKWAGAVGFLNLVLTE